MPTDKLSATQAPGVFHRWSKRRSMRGEIGFRPTDITFRYISSPGYQPTLKWTYARYGVRLRNVGTGRVYDVQYGTKRWGQQADKLILAKNAPQGTYVLETWFQCYEWDGKPLSRLNDSISWAANLAHSY